MVPARTKAQTIYETYQYLNFGESSGRYERYQRDQRYRRYRIRLLLRLEILEIP